jgi:hypothetical protein
MEDFRRRSLAKGASPLVIEGVQEKRTANKTEKREKWKRESANYTDYAKGREDYNHQLAISNGGQRVALTISKLAERN